MPFKLSQKPTYKWPVPLVIPTDDGKRVKSNFDAEFRRLTQTRINELVNDAKRYERGRFYDEDESAVAMDQATAREILAGWHGIIDDDGEPIPFGEASLDKLLEIPTAAAQIVRAWFESIDIAKRKNSPASLTTG
jgi:hypothetical protein